MQGRSRTCSSALILRSMYLRLKFSNLLPALDLVDGELPLYQFEKSGGGGGGDDPMKGGDGGKRDGWAGRRVVVVGV
ncbi:hypothetical protein LINGRAHAP2_LOCUS9319 [Linum grandiflorum]